jgi:hypothetical protein
VNFDGYKDVIILNTFGGAHSNELETDWDGLVERALVNGKMEIVREVSYRDNDELLEREKQYYRDSALWQLDHPHWYWHGGHHADQWLGGA